MKHLLSLLMVFVLMQVQAFALSGGPVFSGSNTGVTIGTFAGVLVPDGSPSTLSTGGTVVGFDDSNSLGVFSIGVPNVGLASGVFAYFSNGRTFTGTIIGSADPDKLELRALVKAQFNITAVRQTQAANGSISQGLSTTAGGFASGSLKARIKQAPGGFNTTAGVIRISGSASLEVQSANALTGVPVGAITQLSLDLDGFKQSGTTVSTVDISAITNTQQTTSATANSTGGTTTGG